MVIDSNYGFSELNFNVFVLFLWIIVILLFGWIKFLLEGKGDKRKIIKSMMIGGLLILILILIFSFSFIPKLTWSDMEIRDFKANLIKDDWGNYPAASDNLEIYLITNSIPEIKNKIDQSEKYIWKDNDNPYAFILISKLNDKRDMENIKGRGTKIEKKYISDEEIYFYNNPVEYEGNIENLKIYIWEEDKFFFVVGGFWNIPEGLIKKLIKKYAENPTSSVIEPTRNMLENQIKTLL
ncbi:hypothetical protein FP803_02175 [Candidatus Woesearchaeota archaeon]|nr:hypothetical protein [Candidatus Woesearchaeota archaeon]